MTEILEDRVAGRSSGGSWSVVRVVVAVLALAGTAAVLALPGRLPLLSWIPFAVGASQVLRLPRRAALLLILAGGALLPAVAVLKPPATSDDMYRYVWDGTVQLSGTDPYRYAPDAPRLESHRDPFLWPAGPTHWCVPSGCTRINRPTVPTIYPPVAEAVFAAADLAAPAGSRETPMQLTMAGFAFATGIFLWYGLSRLGLDPRRAVLWAWCPLVALEAGNNAHVDVVAVLLTAIGLTVGARATGRRAVAVGGAILGLAVGTKLTPALILPAVLRRRPVTVLAACAGAFLTVYLPHVLAVGPKVIGYLPGYLHEEGFTDGGRFALLSVLLPVPLQAPAAVLILAVVALLVWRRGDPDRPWRGASVLVAASLLVTSPSYPWYALLLVALIAFGAPVEWFVLVGAAYLAQFALEVHLTFGTAERIGYGVALAVILGGHLIRRRTVPEEPPCPTSTS